MAYKIVAAAIQMTAGEDKAANLATAISRIHGAAAADARLIVLPEMFLCYGRPEVMLREAEDIPGPTSERLAEEARRLGVTLVAGSYCERGGPEGRVFNTSLAIGPDGAVWGQYRKLHLFDVDIPGRVTVRESSYLAPGDAPLVVEHGSLRLGVAICYDLRFPAVFAALADAGANAIAAPAAFTRATGQDHWDVLLRARALETQSFIVAANQVGRHGKDLITHGGSAIVDPWGTILAQALDDEPHALAELDFARLDDVRRGLPVLAHRRAVPAARIVRVASSN